MASVPNSGSAAPPPPVWDAKPSGPSQTGYGGFWIRVVAYIIDGILLNIAFGIIGAIVGVSMIPVDPTKLDSAENMAQMGRFEIVALVVTWLYFALMESSPRGATVGKMVLGLRVVDEQGNRTLLCEIRFHHHPDDRLPHGGLHRSQARPARHDRRHAGGQNPLKRPPEDNLTGPSEGR